VTSYAQVTWYCACAVNFVAFIMGKHYFSPITRLNRRRSALKVTNWIGILGSGISNMWTIFTPGRGHVTAHAQLLFQITEMWSNIQYSLAYSVTDSHRIMKIGMWVAHEKRCTLSRSKCRGHKVMRGNSTKTSNISRKRHSVVEMHLSYRKSRSRGERMAGSDFWPEVPK